MKQIGIAALAIALISSGAAYGADIYNSAGSLKDSSSLDSPKVIWSGVYIGGEIGYGNANHNLTLQSYNGAYCYDTYGDKAPFSEYFNPRDPYNQEANIFGDPRVVNLPTEGDCGDVLTNGEGGQYAPVDASTKNEANLDGANSHGVVGGVTAGADIQRSRFVFGVLGGYDWTGMETKFSIGDFKAGLEKQDEWYLGGRLGYLLSERTLVYVLAAYVQTDYDLTAKLGDESFKKTTTFNGIKAGVGVEHALTNNIFIGLQYTHDFYNEETIADTGATEAGGFGVRLKDDLDEDKIMVTGKIKTGLGLPRLD